MLYFSLIWRISHWLMFHVDNEGYGWILLPVLRRNRYMIYQSKNIASGTAELFCSNCRNPKALEGLWVKKSMVWIHSSCMQVSLREDTQLGGITHVVALCYAYSALRNDIKLPLDTWYTHASKKKCLCTFWETDITEFYSGIIYLSGLLYQHF